MITINDDLIEPEALKFYPELSTDQLLQLAYSQAISLKRIADAVDKPKKSFLEDLPND